MLNRPHLRPPPLLRGIEHLAAAVALVALATLVGLWIAPRWGTSAVDMIYLPAVLASAALWGIGPALLAAVAATLAYNYFFTAPFHTLRINSAADIVTVVVLFIVALVTSQLAAGIRKQAEVAAAHASRNATIAGFAGRLLSCSTEKELARIACEELRRLFGCNTLMVSGLPEPQLLAAAPEGNRLTPSDVAAAALTLETGKPAGRATARIQPAEWQFHPVHSSAAMLAAAGLARDDGEPPVAEEQLPLLGSLLDQLALALERARLERETREIGNLREREQVRSALLASIGKDFEPRLSNILAASREQRRKGVENKEYVSTVESETAKMQRYISGLLELDPPEGQKPLQVGGVRIDIFSRSVSRDGKPIHLTPKEYLVLSELAKHPGRVLTHSHLLRAAWGPAQENQTEYLRVTIRALRQKLEQDPGRPAIIMNEPAVGYRLAV
jgi:two-component system sensor histidine kinase KdpD